MVLKDFLHLKRKRKMMLIVEQSLGKILIILTIGIAGCGHPIDTHYIPTPEEECIRESECKYA